MLAAWTVISLVGRVIEARAVEALRVGAAVSLAHADLVLVAGIAFVFSIGWGLFMGGASVLVGLVACAIAQGLWSHWPLRHRYGGHASMGNRPDMAFVCRDGLCRWGLAHLPARGMAAGAHVRCRFGDSGA